MKQKRAPLLIILSLTILLLYGCNQNPQSRPQQQNNQVNEIAKIIVSMGNASIDNYMFLQNQLTEMGKAAQLEFVWLDARNDALQQAADLKKAPEEQAKVVIVEAVEPDMLKAAIQELQKNGIKIICLGNLPADLPVDAFITPDFQRAGEIQGQQVLTKATGSKPLDVLILRGPKDSTTAENIVDGNLAALQGNKNIGTVSIEEIAGWNASTAFEVVKTALAKSSPPQAILCHSPEITAAAIQAVEQQGLVGQVQTYGMGTQSQAIDALEQGKHTAEVDFMPEQLAQTLLETAKSLSQGEGWSYERQIANGTHNIPAKFIPIRSITIDNLYLLQSRMEKLKQDQAHGGNAQQNSSGTNNNSADNQEGGNSEGNFGTGNPNGEKQGGQEQAQPKTILKVKTKDGKTFQMEIAGEIETIEVNGGAQQGQETQGRQEEEQGQEGEQTERR